MKINLDFYKEKQESLMQIEEEILKIIRENEKEKYQELAENDGRLDVLQALSMLRKNIINWYPIEKESNVLEINANFGELTEELCEKANKVISIEKSLKKVKAIEKRLEKTANLEVIVGKLKNIELQEKFDYILINSLEEQELLIEDYLQFAKKYLKNDGTILFTTDNEFGLKTYHINCKETKDKKCISRNRIEEVLRKFDMKNYKFYYPLPDYKMPNVIFTDKHMPSSESILRDFTLYDENDILVFSEREKYKKILKEDKNLFKVFANSYLVEISAKDNKIEFVSFGNSRKEKYRMKTVMLEDVVYKQNVTEKGKEHLERIKENIRILKDLNINLLDSYDEDKIYSNLIRKEKTLDRVLIQKSEDGRNEEAIELIEKFVAEIKEKLYKEEEKEKTTVFEKYHIEVEEDMNNKLHYTAFGIFDLIFQNCFYIDDKFYFYDQEWMEENIPIEFITYRSINYLANSKSEINREELYKKFGIIEYIEIFEKLEKILQEKIKDEYIWKIHTLNNTTVKNIYDTQIHYKNLKELAEKQLLNEQESKKIEINQRDKKIKELTDKINYMKNSKSWKMTKVFRFLKRGMNNERKE